MINKPPIICKQVMDYLVIYMIESEHARHFVFKSLVRFRV